MYNIQTDELYELYEGNIILVYEGEPCELTNIGTDTAVVTWSCVPKIDWFPYRQNTLDLTGSCMFIQDWVVDDTDKGQPLHQMIHDTLYHRIVNESLKPEDHLLECFLTEDMEMSGTLARKAIIRLEKEGLVKRKRGRAIVESVSCQDIESTFKVRSALEGLTISNGVCHVMQEGIQYMERTNEGFCRTLVKSGMLASVGADEAFHDIIYQLSDNRTLLKFIRGFESTMYRFRVGVLNTLTTGSQFRNMRPLSRN